MIEAVICSVVLFVWLMNQRLTLLESLVDEHWRARRSIKNYEQKENK